MSLFHCIGHTASKRFNDIVTITALIVFLAVMQCFLMILLCVIVAKINVEALARRLKHCKRFGRPEI